MAAASSVSTDYASSPSGFVISFLLVGIMGMIGYQWVSQNKKLDQAVVNYNSLNTTVKVLETTVGILDRTVRELVEEKRRKM